MDTMNAAIVGLVGALVGAGASLIGLWIQQHHQTKRERVKVAADLGLAEYLKDIELAKTQGGGIVSPLAGYVIFHERLLEKLSKGSVTPEDVKALCEERDQVLTAFPSAPKEKEDGDNL